MAEAALLSDPVSAAPLAASFRDPSGFVFRDDRGTLLRQVNHCHRPHFDALHQSGLYDALVADGQLVEHQIVDRGGAAAGDAYAVIRPREIPLVAYPYEWAFGALQDAALLTLTLQSRALDHGMSLRDASAYNVQFTGCRPVFIDTLSFERYPPDRPWAAYGQFCRHFLAPLLLMARVNVDLGRLAQLYIDGVPLDLAAELLPWRTRLSLGVQLHVHMHARMLRKHSNTSMEKRAPAASLPKQKLRLLLDNLRSLVAGLTWLPRGTEWSDYYQVNSYSQESAGNKRQLVARYLDAIEPRTVWDLGANTGVYSRLATEQGAYCVAWDVDPACVEQAYRRGKSRNDATLLPLRLDLANPSPSLGWAHAERTSLAERGPVDCVMALALIHHLAISNNVPLSHIAAFFERLGRHVIVEWVPKSDSQVQRLLRSREDIFDGYRQAAFEAAFRRFFHIADSSPVGSEGRILYRMIRRD